MWFLGIISIGIFLKIAERIAKMKKESLVYSIVYETHRDKPSSYKIEAVGDWKQIELLARKINEAIDKIEEL